MDWLPEDHLARLILELVATLDLAGILAVYERELRGFSPAQPADEGRTVAVRLQRRGPVVPQDRAADLQRMGLVKLGNVSLDGTKLKANASKHKAMSHERMLDEERRLKEKIDGLLKSAEATDATEDTQHGRVVRGDELPSELRRAEARRDRIRQAPEALEAEAREAKESPTPTVRPRTRPSAVSPTPRAAP